MKYRAKTLCAAAFEDDVSRLRLLSLASAPGGLADDEDWTEEHEAAVQSLMHELCPTLMKDPGGGEGGEEEDVSDPEPEEEEKEKLKAIAHARLRRQAVGAMLAAPDLLPSGTSPVTLTNYGISLSVREDAAQETSEEAAIGEVRVTYYWKPCQHSTYAATPLHWAVLARAHAAVRFLVLHEAPCDATVCWREKTEKDVFQLPDDVTPAAVAAANRSPATLRVLEAAIAERDAVYQKEEESIVDINGSVEQRHGRRERRRLEAEQAQDAAQAEEEEEQGDNEDA